jgi:uncharacterized protein (TIGR02328 family)
MGLIMRLWHIDLIPYLPRQQLIAQWRELNSIFAKQDNHILINYIYKYDKSYLLNYTNRVMREMMERGYRINSTLNYTLYFKGTDGYQVNQRFAEHDFEYLTMCFWNLKEKFIRGQKDFTVQQWGKILFFYEEQGILYYKGGPVV